MNYYIILQLEGLVGIVTLANFPPKDHQVQKPPAQIAHVLWSDGQKWNFRPLDTLKWGEFKSFKTTELPVEIPKEASPFLCLSPTELPRETNQLPTNKLMDTTPAWRANIQLASAYTSTSYQGDYPGHMLYINSGTFLSLGTLIQAKKGILNKLFLPNIHSTPEIIDCEISFMRMRSKQIIKTAVVQRNKSTMVNLSDIVSDDSDPLVVLSTKTVGVPTFLSHDANFKYMSFEHTHPPAEMVFMGPREKYQSNMKKWWFQRMPKS
jgi:hypothetical protein